jgi:hypothetical protein
VKLAGTLAERVDRTLLAERAALVLGPANVRLEDEGVCLVLRVDDGARVLRVDLPEQGIKLLRGQKSADFALLIARGEGEVFDAHVIELKATVSAKAWDTVREQLEWGVVHALAIAGILGVEIAGVSTYTAFHQDKLTEERTPDPITLKLPVGPHATGDARRWAEARRSWREGRLRMELLGREIEHRPLACVEGRASAVECQAREAEAETAWLFAIADE